MLSMFVPNNPLEALSTKPSLIVLISSFGVATRCGYVTPNFSTVLPISDNYGAVCCGLSALSHRREFHILAVLLFFFLFFSWVNPMGVGRASVYNNVSSVLFRGSLALLCAACRTFVDTLVLLCGFFAYYMANYSLYILPPDRAGPR